MSATNKIPYLMSPQGILKHLIATRLGIHKSFKKSEEEETIALSTKKRKKLVTTVLHIRHKQRYTTKYTLPYVYVHVNKKRHRQAKAGKAAAAKGKGKNTEKNGKHKSLVYRYAAVRKVNIARTISFFFLQSQLNLFFALCCEMLMMIITCCTKVN